MRALPKNRSIFFRLSFLFILLLLILTNGCGSIVSIEEYTAYWVGKNIDDKKGAHSEAYQKEFSNKLDNGNWVYIESDKPGCFIHWEVNPQGTIVGYKLKGNCR